VKARKEHARKAVILPRKIAPIADRNCWIIASGHSGLRLLWPKRTIGSATVSGSAACFGSRSLARSANLLPRPRDQS